MGHMVTAMTPVTTHSVPENKIPRSPSGTAGFGILSPKKWFGGATLRKSTTMRNRKTEERLVAFYIATCVCATRIYCACCSHDVSMAGGSTQLAQVRLRL